MDAGGSSDECQSWLVYDGQMIATLSPSLLLPLTPPWSPKEFFESMASSPTAPVGLLRLPNLDDEYMLPLQIGPCPPQADLAAATPAGPSNANQEIIVPRDIRDGFSLLTDRLLWALAHLRSFVEPVLIQVWAPHKIGDRHVLTTIEEPFLLHCQNSRLVQYREVSTMFMFSIDSSDPRELGLPGRVFKHKAPEWTPNVQYYNSVEYPQLSHAIAHNIHGTIMLPVFDPFTQSSIAVIELITTSKKINYAEEVTEICKSLEAVNLKSTNILDRPNVQIYDKGPQSALDDITTLLSVICETLKLPLAQTWVPCVKRSCLCLTGHCVHKVCLAASDVAFHVVDANMWGFRDACTEHLLHKGQGVSGTAFLSQNPCFSKDVTQLCKLDYPLVHYARMFGLAACLAVCMQSSHTGDDVYILEFFLPPRCREDAEQKALLESILALMKQTGHSLKAGVDGDFECLQDSGSFVIEYEKLKETDAQNSGGRQCESRLDRRSMSPETAGGNDGNYAEHHFSGDLTNAGKSRAKSEVWQHFMKNGARACCKHCSKDYAADTRKHGTSRLRRHLVDAHNLKVAVEADSHSLQASDMTVAEKEELMETNSQSSHSRHCESLGYSTPNSTCNTVVSRDVQYKLSGETLNADKSRAKSEVWQHFAKDGALAYCRYCSKVYEADSRKNGTSRLWRHLSGFHRINKRLVS